MTHEIMVLSCFLVLFHCEYAQQLPCSFNPLCTCSKPGPALGWVQCHQVTLISLPHDLYNKTIYILSLKNNNLRILEKERFFIPGIWRLEIQHNFLTEVPSKIFANTKNTLQELDFSYNKLTAIPHQALVHLNRLQKLDLSYNKICEIHSEDFVGLKKSLKILRLSGNSLAFINPNSFNDFELLHTLDISHNMINTIDEQLFQKGSSQLKYINIAYNQLQKIPFAGVVHLKQLQLLNLMHNRISALSDSHFQGHLSIDELHLEYNDINSLLPFSFQNFKFINKTFLTANPIASISNDSFNGVSIKELHLRQCEISMISTNSFQGLDESIEILDLNSNNITFFPITAIKNLKKLKSLNIAENRFSVSEHLFQEIEENLQNIDLSGKYMGHISFQVFASIHNLKQLAINGITGSTLEKDLFKGFAQGFEKLSLKSNELSEIEDDAFHYLPGLRHLDLSYNRIAKIQSMAFKDIGYSLETLDLHHALITQIISYPFQHLFKLYNLDISDNRLQSLPADMFVWMKNIRYITINHNLISEIEPHYFQYINNPDIIWIKFSFNMIKGIKHRTFHNLQNLTYLELNDNYIKFIEKAAFLNLPCITNIQLQGNKINTLDIESFQNLPKLQILNLAYNDLKTLNLDVFDQVGTLSALKVDVSYNSIQRLGENDTNWQPVCAIQLLDLTHNNISYISPQYFHPVKNSLTHLILTNNNLFNVTNYVFSTLFHLLKLEIQNNKIQALEEDSLVGLEKLLVFNISHNNLDDVPADIFRENHDLEIFDVSYNVLRGLPADVFKGTKLKILEISHNKMIHFPDDAILPVNNTLEHLDLSHNNIRVINYSHVKFLTKLVCLDLSQNHLRQIEQSSLASLQKLIVLDLSHNLFQKSIHLSIQSLPNSTQTLNLANTNLTTFPQINLPNLLELNFSMNQLSSLTAKMFVNISNLRALDISKNNLQQFTDGVWHVLPYLQKLHLCGNPIFNISNDSFASLNRLEELHIVNLPLEYIGINVFHSLSTLQSLEMNTYPQIETYDLGQLIIKNHALSHINLHVQENSFGTKPTATFPRALRQITFQGNQLETTYQPILNLIESRELDLHIHNTNVSELSPTFFSNLGKVNYLKIDVRDNSLQTMADFKIAETSGKVHQIKFGSMLLSGNPWQCDCKLAWVKEWIKEKNYIEKKEVISDNEAIKNLRETECINRNNHSIIEVLKTELHCYSSSQSSLALRNEFSFYNILVTWIIFISIFSPM